MAYFVDEDYPYEDVLWHCIGDECDGVVCVGDYYISVGNMYDALRLNATVDQFFAHYDMELENYSLPEKKRKTIPNLENYVKMTNEKR